MRYIVVAVIFWFTAFTASGCKKTANDEEETQLGCVEDETQCRSHMRETCENGAWKPYYDCSANGMTCAMQEGVATCIELASGDLGTDTDTDTDVDADADMDADMDADTNTAYVLTTRKVARSAERLYVLCEPTRFLVDTIDVLNEGRVPSDIATAKQQEIITRTRMSVLLNLH